MVLFINIVDTYMRSIKHNPLLGGIDGSADKEKEAHTQNMPPPLYDDSRDDIETNNTKQVRHLITSSLKTKSNNSNIMFRLIGKCNLWMFLAIASISLHFFRNLQTISTTTYSQWDDMPTDQIIELAADTIPDGKCRRSINEYTVNELDIQSPMITVIVPIYKGSIFISQLMETIINQTYECLEVLVTLEPCDDVNETIRILEKYQSQYPKKLSMTIHLQEHRLQFAGIMNWLYEHVEGEYYSYLQCDNTLPSNYYEVLAQCLEENPKAVNCYPRVVGVEKDATSGEMKELEEIRQESLIGPVHERVWKAIEGKHWVPFRGVVRRPEYGTNIDGSMARFSQPRLHKIYTASDLVVIVKQSIAGELIEMDLPYYKLKRPDSIANSQRYNNSVLSIEDYKLGVIDEYTNKCNIAYSYGQSSEKLIELCKRKMSEGTNWFLRNNRDIRDQAVITQAINQMRASFIGRMQQVKRVAILGAGIQGCLMALMFKRHGYDVTLIDKSNDIMNRASTAGESRIHLGLEYSNDPSMKTASYMLESALRFSSYVEYLLGHKLDWSSLKSRRLTCLVAKTSLVSPNQFEEYGEKLGNMYEDILSSHPELSYFNERPPKILIGKTQIPSVVNSSLIEAAYESIEICLLAKKLKEVIRVALHEASVNIVLGRTVLDVKENKKDEFGRLRVISDIGEHDYDVVVNALWEGRAAIDEKMKVNNNAENESYRVKASVRLPNHHSLSNLPAVSIVNGPFGDFVRYGPKDQLYFAWHPASPSIITKNFTEIFKGFERHANVDFPSGFEEEMIDNNKKAFEMIFPGVDTSIFDSAIVGAGYVVANGEVDIADQSSGFHERRDTPNLISPNGYVSVKTQKFTNAPYNVYLLEQELFVKDLLTPKRIA